MQSERKFITFEEAVSLLKNGETIHTFTQTPVSLIGVDCDIITILGMIKNAKTIEIGGDVCRKLKHGLCLQRHDEFFVFIETDEGKLNEFDPI